MSDIDIDEESKKSLQDILSEIIGEKVEIQEIRKVEKGNNANNDRHIKTILKDGRIFGLKAAERVGDGTRREHLTAFSARQMSLPGSGLSALFDMPADLPLARKQVALLEWVPQSDAIADMSQASAKRKSVKTAEQLGKWMWLCLRLGVEDRHLGNWVWSEKCGILAMIDNEDWRLGQQQPPERHRPLIHQLLNGSSKKSSISEAQAKGIYRGLVQANNAFKDCNKSIEAEFKDKGEKAPTAYSEDELIEIACGLSGFSKATLLA